MWLELSEQGARGRGGGEERAGRGQGRAFGTVREFGITRCCRRMCKGPVYVRKAFVPQLPVM